MAQLEVGDYKVVISSLGAELTSFQFRDLECLWQGSPNSWPERAPILFPVIGVLQNQTFLINGRGYKPGFHGFAKNLEFEQKSDPRCLVLNSSKATRELYPFEFQLIVLFDLNKEGLRVEYQVRNHDEKTMFFSLGTHPGFNIPMEDFRMDSWFLEFEKEERTQAFLVEKSLIGPRQGLQFQGTLLSGLEDAIANWGTLIFQNLKSRSILLRFPQTGYDIAVEYLGFPYLGLWKYRHSPFLCIENWAGIPDTTTASGQLAEKEGSITLQPGGIWKAEVMYRVVPTQNSEK